MSRAVRLCARSGDEGRERTTTGLLSLLKDGRRRAAAGRRGARGRRVLDGGDGRTEADHLSRAGRRKGRGIAGGCNPRLVIRAAAF